MRPVQRQVDITSSPQPNPPSTSAAEAAAEQSQRRLVQLSLLLRPDVEDEPGR
jgi:hypothetical protein